MAAEIVDLKSQFQAMIVAYLVFFEIDGDFIARVFGGALKKIVRYGVADSDGQNAVLEAIVVEDIGETWGDDHAETVILQRPWSVLATRSATEVPPRQQHTRVAILGQIENKFRIIRPVVQVAPIEKKEFFIARSLNSFEELLRDNLIGIDVRPIHGQDKAGVGGEGSHIDFRCG